MKRSSTERTESLLEKVFAEQVLSAESYIEEHEAVCAAASDVLAMWKSTTSLEWKKISSVDQNTRPAQILPAHITQLSVQLFFLHRYFWKGWIHGLQSIAGALVFKVRQILCDRSNLIMLNACVSDVAAKPSTVPHPDSEMGCFATTSFASRKVVGYNYGILAYADLGSLLQDNSTYEDGLMSVSKHNIVTYSACWKRTVKTIYGGQKSVRTALTEFNTMLLMNDSGYLCQEREEQPHIHKAQVFRFLKMGICCTDVNLQATRCYRWKQTIRNIQGINFWSHTEVPIGLNNSRFSKTLVIFLSYWSILAHSLGDLPILLTFLRNYDRPYDLYLIFQYSLCS